MARPAAAEPGEPLGVPLPQSGCTFAPRLPISWSSMTTIDDIIENFALLDDWDDRYRYVIELGRTLAPLPEAVRTEANKVQGCAS